MASESKGSLQAQCCVLAWMDLLGQTPELEKWNRSPRGNVANDPEMMQGLTNTIALVHRWRGLFDDTQREFFDTLQPLSEQAQAQMPPDLARQYREYCQTTVTTRFFSDTYVAYSPIQNVYDHWQTSNVLGLITTCGTLMLEALAHGTVFRGAIELGWLTHIPSRHEGILDDPYGPAIANAHRLESGSAEYPRIVIGPRLLEYFDDLEALPSCDAPSAMNRQNVTECRRRLWQDPVDNLWSVDYLGEGYEFPEALGTIEYMRTRALEFVRRELGKCRTEKNKKLIERYERMVGYFKARLGQPE